MREEGGEDVSVRVYVGYIITTCNVTQCLCYVCVCVHKDRSVSAPSSRAGGVSFCVLSTIHHITPGIIYIERERENACRVWSAGPLFETSVALLIHRNSRTFIVIIKTKKKREEEENTKVDFNEGFFLINCPCWWREHRINLDLLTLIRFELQAHTHTHHSFLFFLTRARRG